MNAPTEQRVAEILAMTSTDSRRGDMAALALYIAALRACLTEAEAERDQMRSNASTAAFDKVNDQLGEANQENESLRSQLAALSAEANKLCGLLGITDDRPLLDALQAAYKEVQARAHAVAVLPEPTGDDLQAMASEMHVDGDLVDFLAGASKVALWYRSRIRTIGPDHLQALEECADVVLEYAPESSWVRNDTSLTRAARRIADIRKAAQEGTAT